MQLGKAIEILSYDLNDPEPFGNPDLKEAIQLGFEAMKAITAWRRDWEANRFHLLPGETPDVIQPPCATPISKP